VSKSTFNMSKTSIYFHLLNMHRRTTEIYTEYIVGSV